MRSIVFLLALTAAGDAIAGQTPELELELITDGLSAPLAARHAGDGSGRIFVLEQDGLVRVISARGILQPEPFLDLTGMTSQSGERGLLGIDFHPEYETNGYVYVNYTADPADPANAIEVGDTVIARYSVSPADPNQADPGSAQLVLTVPQDFTNHNGGDIHFGPDGYLYIGMGDGGSGGDPRDRAQAPQSLLGKMLRIDVDNVQTAAGSCGDDAGGPVAYAIPATNPFAGDDGICDEIWAFGVRNPYRFSFDRITGDMFIADVGQGDQEEISFQPAASGGGENYGWDCFEGNLPFGASAAVCDGANPPAVVPPILTYDHPEREGRSVTGGYRYRGPLAASEGLYFYADFVTREYFIGVENGGLWTSQTVSVIRDTEGNNLNPTPSGFGEDEAGNLYFVDRGGRLYRYGELVFADGQEE
ncbi:MAG: PQQ-dependent sugar dehydrogenase [Pseudomonadota bacterium]